MQPTTPMQPPPPAYDDEPVPTVEDPTAGGHFCGSRRKTSQVDQERQAGNPNAWPWCRMRAGRGTDHVGFGLCRNHGGTSPGGRTAARLRLDELVGPAIATIARIIADPEAPVSVRLRAAQDILDRSGYPRRVDVDVDAARAQLVDRIVALQAGDDSTN